jgi:hypothetical protein
LAPPSTIRQFLHEKQRFSVRKGGDFARNPTHFFCWVLANAYASSNRVLAFLA